MHWCPQQYVSICVRVLEFLAMALGDTFMVNNMTTPAIALHCIPVCVLGLVLIYSFLHVFRRASVVKVALTAYRNDRLRMQTGIIAKTPQRLLAAILVMAGSYLKCIAG